MTDSLRMVSVCRSLPTANDPSNGIFVLNRLAAMSAQADVQVIQQIPYLPGVRPIPAWAQAPSRQAGALTIRHAPMFYVPGVLKSFDSFWLERALRGPIGSLHRQQPLDLIDAHFGYPEGVSCVRLARRLGIPVFITIRGFEAEFVHKRGIGGQLVRALRTATGCISVSHSLRELALRHGVAPERVAVVHNAIDAATFHWGEQAAARQQLGLPADVPVVVSVGHLIERKRHHVLIEAFAAMRRTHPQAILAIVGGKSFEPQYPQLLENRARELGVLEAVRFLGNLPPSRVATWLQAADTFALATAREGCCNAVLEALAVGVPVVTTAVGDNAYFVKNGVNGHVVAVDDVASLSQALQQALGPSDWDRQRISRDLIASVGSWSGVARRVLTFMHERLQDTPRPALAAELH